MLVAQNSLGSVCPVPLTVRGNPAGRHRRELVGREEGVCFGDEQDVLDERQVVPAPGPYGLPVADERVGVIYCASLRLRANLRRQCALVSV